MASEAYKGLIRMSTNYVRLILSVLMGLVFFRIALRYGGKDVTALILLLGSSAGLAAVFIDIMRASLVREVGSAWHDADRDVFRVVYNSAIGLCLLLVLPTLLVTGVLVAIVPILKIDPNLVGAARIFILTRGLELSLVLVLTCPIRMYLVKEHYVWANLIELLRRAAQLLGAVIVFLVLDIDDPARGLAFFGVVSMILLAAVMLVSAACITLTDRSLVPSIARISWSAVAKIVSTVKWNAGVILATGIHLPADQFVMNLVFGLPGNLVFGFAQTFSSYVLRLTVGTTDGLDAVSVRMSSKDGTGALTRSLFHHATRLQTLVATSAGVLVSIYALPLMTLWLGKQDNAAQTIPLAAPLIGAIMFGIIARAISEGWMRILYGAGHVHRYAKLMLIGAVCNPIIAITLALTLPAKPMIVGNFGPNFFGPALAYAITIFVFQLLLLPRIAASCLGMRTRDVFKPMLAPCIVVALATPILIVARWYLDWTNFVGSACASALFGAAVVVLYIMLGMSQEERHRFAGAIRRRVLPRS